MRQTTFQALRKLGAPDGLLTVLSGLLVVLALSPWLDVEIAGVAIKEAIPFRKAVDDLLKAAAQLDALPDTRG